MENACILCKSKKYTVLFKIKKYDIVRCKVCNLVYTLQSPNKKDLDKLYKNYDYKTGFSFESLIRKDAIRTLRNFRNLGSKKKNLLDAGCGAGFLLDEARKQGWETFGIDTALIPTEYARKKLNLQVARKDIHALSTKKRFTAITLIQVIEHIQNPRPMLKKIKSLLVKNGILCVATPNITSILAKVLGKQFQYLIPPEHLVYYSPETLRELLESEGFTVVKTTSFGYADDLGAIYRYVRGGHKAYSETKQKNALEANNHKNLLPENLEKIKSFKHYLFENVVRELSYPLLNIGNNGSMVEIYAKKQ